MITLTGWKFAPPMDVELPEAWHFYHTMDVPSPDGIVTHHGQWDLRGRYDDYLYGIDVKGKSVLDIGTASGWISFEVERRGAAEVVGLDRADDVHRQLVPYAFLDPEHTKVQDDDRAAALARFRSRNYPKAYWYCHRRYRSSAKVVYGDAHTAGDHISGADIVVLGQILVHQRDPLEVLHQAARIANESLVIVEGSFELEQPVMAFCGQGGNFYSWFHLSIGMYRLYLAILGFEITSVRRSAYRCNHVDLTGDIELWTIVAKRTAPTLGRPASIGDP